MRLSLLFSRFKASRGALPSAPPFLFSAVSFVKSSRGPPTVRPGRCAVQAPGTWGAAAYGSVLKAPCRVSPSGEQDSRLKVICFGKKQILSKTEQKNASRGEWPVAGFRAAKHSTG